MKLRNADATRRIAMAIVVASLLVAAGCGSSGTTRSGAGEMVQIGALRVPSAPPGVSHARLARLIAASLLESVRTPTWAATLAAPPRGSAIAFTPEREATPNLVDAHRIWHLPSAPRSLIAAVERTLPAGFSRGGSGSKGERRPNESEHEYWWYVAFNAPLRPGLSSEKLVISSTEAPSGALLRADAEVVWISPRPATELLPHSVRSVAVERVTTAGELFEQEREYEAQHRGARRHRRIPENGVVNLRHLIANPTAVREISSVLDDLPIVQPGATLLCPAEPWGPLVRLVFRDRTGAVVAKAAQGAGSEVGACSPLFFSIKGRVQRPLAEGKRVIAVIDRILGVELL